METTNYNQLESKMAETTIALVNSVNDDVRRANIKGVNTLIRMCDNNKIAFKHPIHIDNCYVASVALENDTINIATTPHYKEGEVTFKDIKNFKTKHIAKIFNRMASAISKRCIETIEDTNNKVETETQE